MVSLSWGLGKGRPCERAAATTGETGRSAALRPPERRPVARPEADVVSRLYEAVLERRDWPAALGALAGMVDASAAHMVRWSRDAPERITGGAVWNLAESHHDAYVRAWHRRDPRHAAFRRLAPGSIATDHDLLPAAAIAGDPFYREFLAGAGLRWGIVAEVPLEHDRALRVGLLRRPARGPFGAVEKAELAPVCPHLARVALVDERLRGADRERDGLRAALDRLSEATFLVDAEGTIAFANAAARNLVAADIGIHDADGRLTLARPRARDELARRIRATCLAPPAGMPPQGDTLSVVPAPERRPLTLTVLPAATRPGAPAGWAIVTIRDLDRPAPAAAAAEPLRALFDLTRAEAAVAAAVAAGRSPREIAADRGIATSTVRSQLAAVFRKTGTARQAELAVLVGRLTGPDRAVA